MAEKEKDEAPKVEATTSGAGMNPKMLMGLMGLNMVIMLAVVIVLFLGQKKKDASVSVEQIAQGAAEGGGHGAATPAAGAGGHGEPGKGAESTAKNDIRFFGIGDFTSNLAGPASSHYVKVNVNFELSKDVDEEELKKRKSQIRDKVISLLNSKKPADLQNVEGQNFLKEEIKTSVNGVLQTGKVEGVYFSTFIVN